MKSVRLTKRLQRQYQKVLAGEAHLWFYPHPVAYFGAFSSSASGRRDGPAWQAYLFAKEWGGREGVDVKRLERMVERSGSAECAFLFARDVRGARVRRLQAVVAKSADRESIRRFIHIPGADASFLKRVLLASEVMGS